MSTAEPHYGVHLEVLELKVAGSRSPDTATRISGEF